jgi:hypothetical protein
MGNVEELNTWKSVDKAAKENNERLDALIREQRTANELQQQTNLLLVQVLQMLAAARPAQPPQQHASTLYPSGHQDDPTGPWRP